MIDLELLSFLIENHKEILQVPIYGHLRDVFAIYSISLPSLHFDDFMNRIHEIEEVAPDSLIFKETNSLSDETYLLNSINVFLLDLLYKQFIPKKPITKEEEQEDNNDSDDTMVEDKSDLSKLMSLIDFDKENAELTYNNSQLPKFLRNKLTNLLSEEPMSFQLNKERARFTESISPYIPVCQDPEHTENLAHAFYIVNNKIVSLQWSKVTKLENDIPGLVSCLQSYIHYVPNIKAQTDLSLGDCSYLDTCHKLNTCRYLHYLQYMPESLLEQSSAETKRKNKQQANNIPLYTHGSCTSAMVKKILPPQWIRCDVRKFDFNILGKFSVVVADPAWNIHMNLPYGTCNDIELLELPLDQLQDEGVLFLWVTGRAIELGKESLTNWGYKVTNEISWIKTNQLGRTIVTGRTGHWLNHSKEHLLVGIKGNPAWVNKHIDIDIIVSTTRETSRKPDELYGIIERLVDPHARKLEIFGRDHNIRPGWFTIGNQLTGSCIHELDVKSRYDTFAKTNRSAAPASGNENYNNRNMSNPSSSYNNNRSANSKNHKTTGSDQTQRPSRYPNQRGHNNRNNRT